MPPPTSTPARRFHTPFDVDSHTQLVDPPRSKTLKRMVAFVGGISIAGAVVWAWWQYGGGCGERNPPAVAGAGWLGGRSCAASEASGRQRRLPRPPSPRFRRHPPPPAPANTAPAAGRPHRPDAAVGRDGPKAPAPAAPSAPRPRAAPSRGARARSDRGQSGSGGCSARGGGPAAAAPADETRPPRRTRPPAHARTRHAAPAHARHAAAKLTAPADERNQPSDKPGRSPKRPNVVDDPDATMAPSL